MVILTPQSYPLLVYTRMVPLRSADEPGCSISFCYTSLNLQVFLKPCVIVSLLMTKSDNYRSTSRFIYKDIYYCVISFF